MKDEPLVFERTYHAPADKVWTAITNRDEMEKWYFNLKEFRAEKGFKFEFMGGESPEKQFRHLCEVTEVEKGKKIVYSWKYDGHPGISYVEWLLQPQGENTKLTLTHSGLDSFPRLPEFAKNNFQMGWTEILGTSLKKYLEG